MATITPPHHADFMARVESFQKKVPRAKKLATGQAGVSEKPLHVRTIGAKDAPGIGDYVREKLGRRLGKFGPGIERVSVRFTDVNGPRGGVDTAARIKVVLSDLNSVIIESVGVDAVHAFDTASHRVERAVRKSLDRAGISTPKTRAKKVRTARTRVVNPPPAGGALVGRRVGRAASNVARAAERPEKERRDALVDTSQQGVSATDRKAGGGSTAARNTSRGRRATATLEDSATGKPSRKSTRRSAGRAKAGSKQRRRAVSEQRSPKRRASRAQAASSGARRGT